ncbi:MAG: MCP four helix bundle domain-containing protein, partial [Rhodocyclaceae bacterium]|nr:MCP four helix bundle domain-containing protein [Rhodocyclaceae bacterium]
MFKNLRIGLRLGIAFAIALLGLSFVAGLGVNRMANLSGQVEVMAKDRFPKTVWANDIIDSINVMARSMRNTLLLKNEADIAKEMARIPQERKTIDDRIEKLTQTVNSAKGKELLQRVKDARADFLVGQDKLLDMVKKGQRDEAVTYMIGDFRKLQNPYFATVGEIIKFQGALMEEAGREAEATNAASRNLMIGVALSALVFSVLCALWIARSITRPLAESVAAANRLAEGDLTVAITADSTDETGQLKSALQTMIAKLAHTIGEVRGASDQLSNAAQQVSVTSQSLSQAASEQAASIEETTASMEEMTASITQNTENAKVTNNMATQSAQEATEGGIAVRETVEAMKQIAGKIGIIDDIA